MMKDASSTAGSYMDAMGSVSEFSKTSRAYRDGGGSSSGDGSPVGKPDYVDPVVAEKEERAVFWSRLVVICILSIALAAMATTMFLVISKSEEDDYETQVCSQPFVHNFCLCACVIWEIDWNDDPIFISPDFEKTSNLYILGYLLDYLSVNFYLPNT